MPDTMSAFFEEDMLGDEPHNNDTTKQDAVKKGDVNTTFQQHESQMQRVRKRHRKLNRGFTGKELLDRIGYGFGAPQFITILFFLIGASPMLVGVVNGFRDMLNSLFSSFFREFSQVKTFGRTFVSAAGILFGFSLIGVVLAIRMSSEWMYAIALIIGSLGVVVYGELHHKLLDSSLRHERRSLFLRRITHYGLLITAASFFLSGYLLETFGMEGGSVSLFGATIPISGYFISFEIAAVAFILSGFILSKTPVTNERKSYDLRKFFREHFSNGFRAINKYLKDGRLLFMFIGALLLAVIESLGATFYGYHIFTLFEDQYLGGFLNIALIFVIALLASTLGPVITRFLERHIGLAPMFVFGTLLMAFLPFIIITNPHFYAILAATSCAIIGSSILGVSQGLLAQKLLPRSERSVFFKSIGMVLALPFLAFVLFGSYIASIDFILLFKIIVTVLLVVLTPLYFTLVLSSQKQKL